MIISMPNLVAMLTVGHTFLAAGPGRFARGPLTLPSPPPRRPWMGHEAQSAGERGESTPRQAQLPTSGLTAISLTDWLTDLLTHSLSHYPPYPLVRGARAHGAIFTRASAYGVIAPNGLSKKVGVCAWKCVPGPEGRGHSNRSIGTGIPLA